MPFTKDKFLVNENPHLVGWERETRKFLRKLSPDHVHMVSAVMIYEWATGIRIADLMKETTREDLMTAGRRGTWKGDLRKITKVLRYYFGNSTTAYIMGRKVPNAFTVRQGYYITRHRPLTLTLYAEYVEGVLVP